jgi:exodeoxyribonuclease V alpha subunit
MSEGALAGAPSLVIHDGWANPPETPRPPSVYPLPQLLYAILIPMSQSVVLEGTLERVTYHNEENGYTVARLAVKGRGYLVTIVGNMHGLAVGASLKLTGQWQTHTQFGKQFVVEQYAEQLPATVEGIRKYLGSGLIKGIGPVTADRIVGHFGLATLEVIDMAPERLVEVGGVGAVRAEKIASAWAEQLQIKEIMLFLQGHGVSTSLAVKIFKTYGAESIAIVQADPYRLARDIYGIGFLTADKIARQMGVAADSPERMEAGLLYALNELADDGHVFAPRPELLAKAVELLGVPAEAVDPGVDRLAATDGVRLDTVEEGGAEVAAVYLPAFYFAERGVAGRVRAMQATRASRLAAFHGTDWAATMAALDHKLPFPLAERQREAVITALTNKVSVLTGGPGTGKTTTLRAVLQLLTAQGRSVALAAPTGRAAKRLAETTGVEARTLHRLLEFKPSQGSRFLRDRDNPLDVDMVVVDEVSMVDLVLMNALTRALDVTSHLLLVGDVDQLPSVGAGSVLRDLIGSGVVPTVVLDHIFSQAAGSYIVTNAHRINQGQMPLFESDSSDFFLFPVDDAEAAAERVVDVVANRIPARFGYDPVADIQVLSPMHRGAAGVGALNERLQAALNPAGPGKPEVRLGGRVFRLGDKVMQVRNNYDKDIFNGDLGRIVALDVEEQVVTVSFDGVDVPLDYVEMDEVVHAFACSIHKSQGAEYPAVVMALLPAHYMLLQRNLLYTGVTRARALCVLVGAKRAISMAVKNDQIARRHTALAQRLRG